MNNYIVITHKATNLQVISQPDIAKARDYVINHSDHSKGIYYISPMINQRSLDTFKYEINKACNNARIDKETITPGKLITTIGINPLYTAWIIGILDKHYREHLYKHYNLTFVNDTYELTPITKATVKDLVSR